MANKKTILFIIPPASGHLNPCVSIAGELNKKGDIHTIFLGSMPYKSLIEKSRSEFIEYADESYDDIAKSVDKNHSPLVTFTKMMKAADKVFPQILNVCEEKKPDAIIYDMLTIHAKYLFHYIEKHKNSLKFPVPKEILISSSFAFVKNIFPPEEAKKAMLARITPDSIKAITELQNEINAKFDLDFPFNLEFSDIKSGLNICCLFEEFQPEAERIKSFYHFVGPCISDEVRAFNITNEKLKQFMNSFDPINPNYNNLNASKDNLKLVYVSLGTVFNFDINVFEKIIESFHNIDKYDNGTIELKNLRVIISLGQKTFDVFQNKINNENYFLHDNILLLPTAPQIEILKRASLFITHAGMNSMIETIKLGVPVICLPQFADQPMVSRRSCDQLNLGIRLDSFSADFSSEQITKAVTQILLDQKYIENILKFSKLLESEKNNGCVNASNLIRNYIQ